jgi:hypothetical protein
MTRGLDNEKGCAVVYVIAILVCVPLTDEAIREEFR